jgi:hypothetical protein
MKAKNNITRLLPRGEVSAIAKEIGISLSATSSAIRGGNPTHPAVQSALRRIKDSGIVATIETLASLPRLPTAV